MTNKANKPNTVTTPYISEDKETPFVAVTSNKRPSFIVVNTPTIQGYRLNLDKVHSYAKNDDTTIAIARDGGTQSIFKFQNKDQADAVLAQMDSYCLGE